MLTCVVPGQPLIRLSSREEANTLAKDASDGWFLTVYVRLLESPYKRERARKF